MPQLSAIHDFLALKRFAVVGVSRNPKDFTRMLFREFLKRGYQPAAVNPGVSEVEGLPVVPTVEAVSPAVEAALLLTRPAVTESVVKQCHAAGIRFIWLYRAIGKGAISPAAVEWCQANGMRVIDGECPFMFLGAGFPHSLHAACKKLVGAYPKG